MSNKPSFVKAFPYRSFLKKSFLDKNVLRDLCQTNLSLLIFFLTIFPCQNLSKQTFQALKYGKCCFQINKHLTSYIALSVAISPFLLMSFSKKIAGIFSSSRAYSFSAQFNPFAAFQNAKKELRSLHFTKIGFKRKHRFKLKGLCH